MAEIVYIKVFVDYLDAIEPLGDAERGRLFTSLLTYARTGEVPQLGGNERFLFPMMKAQIDRDTLSKEELSAKRSEARRKNKCEQNEHLITSVTLDIKCDQDKDNKTIDQDKDNKTIDQDKDKKKRADAKTDDFDAFWAVYPRKVGKGDAKKAFAKVKAPVSVLISAVNTQKQSQQWLKDNGQYIPNPATWLNQGRWEDELPTNEAAKGVVAHSEKASAQQLESLKEIYRKVKGEQR